MLYTIKSGHKQPKEKVFGICSQNSEGVPQALKSLRDKILWAESWPCLLAAKLPLKMENE